jgi:hypothetical protein
MKTTTAPKTKAPKTISIKAVTESMKKKNKTTTPTPTTEQKPLTDKQILIRERRQALRDLSNELKSMAQINGKEAHVNELLRDFYAGTGHTELKTFEQWKAQGYFVRKGEKALLLWGKPTASKTAIQEATQQGKSEEDADTDFYPLAYLFSKQQVTHYTQK